MTIQKSGGLAFFILAVAFIVPPLIHLSGDLRTVTGPFNYDLADFLSGPVWAAGLVTGILALQEGFGKHSPRRSILALLAAALAGGAMVAVACIRSANRHYHLDHPELNLENDTTVLLVWTTIVAGINATGWHFLGWALVLAGSAGWTSGYLPRVLCGLYMLMGTLSLFVYAIPKFEEVAFLPAVFLFTWQGILLWIAKPGGTQAPEM